MTITHSLAGGVQKTVVGILAGIVGLSSMPATSAQDTIEPEARQIFAAMTGYLAGLNAFAADFEADFDVMTAEGQKLRFISSGDLLVQRPGQMRVTRKGSIADMELVLGDGALTIYGRDINGYFQLPATTIDDAISAIRDDIGFDAPGADLLAASPFDSEVTDVVSGAHIGMTTIDGATVHHLAFRGDAVDWQIWVKDGDQPLPLRYVITSKWMTGAPEYSLQLSNWDVAPKINAGAFMFTAPSGAANLASIAADETGRLVAGGE